MFHLDNVTRTYGQTRALDAVTCAIPLGRVYGLIGANGAGKTTLLRALAGQLPTGGRLTLDGEPVRDNQRALDRIILAGADVPYPGEMSVRTLLDLAASRWSTWDADYARHLQDVFALDRKARFDTLSRGNKTLVGVVMGLAARADVTLLDEPYLGLDARNREHLYRELLEETTRATEAGRTVVISTHQVEDASLLLDAVILIDRGDVVRIADVEALTSSTVVATGTVGAVDDLLARAPRTVLREDSVAGARRVVLDAGRTGDAGDAGAAVAAAALLHASEGLDVRLEDAGLEETVLVSGTR